MCYCWWAKRRGRGRLVLVVGPQNRRIAPRPRFPFHRPWLLALRSILLVLYQGTSTGTFGTNVMFLYSIEASVYPAPLHSRDLLRRIYPYHMFIQRRMTQPLISASAAVVLSNQIPLPRLSHFWALAFVHRRLNRLTLALRDLSRRYAF